MSQLLQPDDTGPAPEPASFEATFRAHCAGLCEFVYAYVRSREIARELVQDLFLRLWELQGTPSAPLGKCYLYTAIPTPGTGPSVLQADRRCVLHHRRHPGEHRSTRSIPMTPGSCMPPPARASRAST